MMPGDGMDGDSIGTAMIENVLRDGWGRLAAAVRDRDHPFHLVTVATIGRDGGPKARAVVLRRVDPAARRLGFNTDARSEKIAELRAEPRIVAQAFDPVARLQLTVAGLATLHQGDAVARAAWDASALMSRTCYGQSHAPGAVIANADGYSRPPATAEATEAGFAHFVAVDITVETLDVYALHSAGHRRTTFHLDESGLVRIVHRAP